MYKRAIILAGGKGTRLKPYTISIPKPLVPLGETPILEIIINQLKKSGFDHITISLNHMAEIIKAFFSDGSKWGLKIDYSEEDHPLSTMGPLSLIDDLPENFLVMNGDVLTDLNYGKLLSFHEKKNSIFTIASYLREERIDYGVLTRNEDNRLIDFSEKPHYQFFVSMGVYVVNKSILTEIPHNTFFGFDHLMKKLIELGKLPYIYEYTGHWLDIGRPDDYERAIELYKPELFI